MIRTSIKGIDVVLETDPRLFSPIEIDAGTLAMLSHVSLATKDKVLDLGCGYGVVGIVAARLIGAERVWLIDNDALAVEIASRNVRANGLDGAAVTQSEGFADFHEAGFTQILSNPPYHADFRVPKQFIHKGFNRLLLGGTLWMVTQRQLWYRNKLKAIFGRVREYSHPPYTVFEATKTSPRYASA
jgi:16S rRNA (guanine1207-N2)-methyltransferase